MQNWAGQELIAQNGGWSLKIGVDRSKERLISQKRGWLLKTGVDCQCKGLPDQYRWLLRICTADLHCRSTAVQLSCTNLNCLSLPLLDFLICGVVLICTDFRLNCKIPMQGLSGVSYWPIEVRTGRGAQHSDFHIGAIGHYRKYLRKYLR